MHKPPLAPIVYSCLLPNPKNTDPPNFQTYINKQLVPEVRAETARFYGHIDCVEAQYPGLDYATAAHRLRLCRFPYHRRLFQVFDQLRLTNHEIQTLCKWEGTRWARERYEKDVGVSVRETTWDGIELARSEPPTVTRITWRGEQNPAAATECMHRREPQPTIDHEGSIRPARILRNARRQQLEAQEEQREYAQQVEGDSMEEEADSIEQESEDELQQSVGVELNQRLIAATEARNRGEEAALDPDWEQWLKEAAERGVAMAGQSLTAPSTAWTTQMTGSLQTDSTRLILPTAYTLAGTANPALEGASAPPTGTAS